MAGRHRIISVWPILMVIECCARPRFSRKDALRRHWLVKGCKASDDPNVNMANRESCQWYLNVIFTQLMCTTPLQPRTKVARHHQLLHLIRRRLPCRSIITCINRHPSMRTQTIRRCFVRQAMAVVQWSSHPMRPLARTTTGTACTLSLDSPCLLPTCLPTHRRPRQDRRSDR